jgi:hypothetical protein
MTRSIFIAAALALAATLPAVPAQAQATRAFVSAVGSDSNNCINTNSPCRHFQAAYNAMSAGGEIDVLDPANYGSLTVTHTLSIVGRGWATLSPVSGGAAITINSGTTDTINISGLALDGTGTTNTSGIVFNSGASLTVTDCVIRHMANYGINFASTTTTSTITVSNSIMNDNVAAGILVQPTGSATAMIDHVEASNNTFDGILVSGANGPHSNTVNATAFDSVVSGNGSIGFYAYSGGASNAPTTFMVSHSAGANNGFGAEANGAGATLHLANSTISGNVNGWTVTGAGGLGVVDSYGDNYIDGNAQNEAAPPSILRK